MSSQQDNVLILGDGNFSFSAAYVLLNPQCSVTATSYDTESQVLEKYPEANGLFKKLSSAATNTNRLHGINACDLKFDVKFDKIIFNHPHCGTEDARRHQRFLSHFLSSAKNCLSSRSSEIVVTLANDQAERWELVSRASRANLYLKSVKVFNSRDYPGYEQKRHQNGKSFQRVLWHGQWCEQQSLEFCFTETEQGAAESQVISETLAAITQTLHEATKVVAGSAKVEDGFACDTCSKRFLTSQGLRTHVHMVHRGKKRGVDIVIQCKKCDRVFKDQESLTQHVNAKHNKIDNDHSVSENLIPMENTTERAEAIHTCDICHFDFKSEPEFEGHLKELVPNITNSYKCENCNRKFNALRDLKQHQAMMRCNNG